MNIQILPHLVLQHIKVNIILVPPPRNPNTITKVINRLRRIPPPPHPINSEYPRIIPTLNPISKDKFVQFTFGKYSVGDVQAGVLPDVGLVEV